MATGGRGPSATPGDRLGGFQAAMLQPRRVTRSHRALSAVASAEQGDSPLGGHVLNHTTCT